MTQLQPDIMIVNGLDQDGSDIGTVGAQGVGEYLITYQRANRGVDIIGGKAFFDSLGKGLPGMGNTGKTIVLGKDLHPIPLTVRNDA